jgi:formate hydrogenlyase subunit 3/multisubunit Na+/H+ antiporter MnhD subunit
MKTFSIESKNTDPHPKKQSRLKGIPWLAFLSLMGVLLCMGASVAIIVISDGQIVESWLVRPAVNLAILSALSNVALGIAFSEAVVSTWWSRAEKGASLEELHYIWNRGEGLTFFSALGAGPSARKVARTMLALIIIKVATGPLLQRATRQELGERVSS